MQEVAVQIVVSDEVGTVLRSLSTAMNMTIDQLLRRFIGLERPTISPVPPPAQAAGGGTLRTREGSLPVGLRLRKVFKGQERRATVERHGIRIEGENRVFLSPSLAAVKVTGYNTNGWLFWDYCDEQTQTWRPLDQFRSGGTGYRIVPYDASLGAELGICNEWRDGPSRHPASYVVSNPVWRQSRAFCDEHLNKVSEEDPNLKAIWERFRAHQSFHGQ
jgi:hypothetical protein